MAAGFVSQRELAGELNRRGIPTALGGSWHRTTVVRMLTRLDLIKLGKGRINNGLATKQAADVRAEAYSPTIWKLRKAGFVSAKDIARELNVQGIQTARGSKWQPTTVSRLLRRLERLDRVSRSQPRR
jgi:arginine repressor